MEVKSILTVTTDFCGEAQLQKKLFDYGQLATVNIQKAFENTGRTITISGKSAEVNVKLIGASHVGTSDRTWKITAYIVNGAEFPGKIPLANDVDENDAPLRPIDNPLVEGNTIVMLLNIDAAYGYIDSIYSNEVDLTFEEPLDKYPEFKDWADIIYIPLEADGIVSDPD